MGNNPRYEVYLVRSCGELEALQDEWDVLADLIGVPMLSHAWVRSCAEFLYSNDQLFIVTVRLKGTLCGIAPLVVVERAGIRRLEFIGVSYLYEPSGLLYNSEEALDALVRAIVNTGLTVLLSRLPSDSPIISRLRSASPRLWFVVAGPAAHTVAVPISSGWNEYFSGLCSRRRYDLRRARHRADRVGKVTFRIYCPRDVQVEAAFEDLVRIEATGWKGRHGSSLRQRSDLRRFFSCYAKLTSELGILRFCFLDLNDKPIAAQLSVEYKERFWVLKVGYDEACSACSPGVQLLAETLRYAFDRKLKSYEFLGSDEPWLQGWAGEERAYSTAACYPTTPRGIYGFAADTVERIRAYVVSRS